MAGSSVLERFLRYVAFDTRSNESISASPSTPGQRALLETLAGELRGMGAEAVSLDEHGYVMATLPPTMTGRLAPVIGFIAHVDTSPELSGEGVRPIVHRAYDGRDLVLPDGPDVRLRLADSPALQSQLGHDIVTASGTTLLVEWTSVQDMEAAVAVVVELCKIWGERPHEKPGPT